MSREFLTNEFEIRHLYVASGAGFRLHFAQRLTDPLVCCNPGRRSAAEAKVKPVAGNFLRLKQFILEVNCIAKSWLYTNNSPPFISFPQIMGTWLTLADCLHCDLYLLHVRHYFIHPAPIEQNLNCFLGYFSVCLFFHNKFNFRRFWLLTVSRRIRCGKSVRRRCRINLAVCEVDGDAYQGGYRYNRNDYAGHLRRIYTTRLVLQSYDVCRDRVAVARGFAPLALRA